MTPPHHHAPHHHAAPRGIELDPGWSLLRLSAGARLGFALVLVAALWGATIAVIA